MGLMIRENEALDINELPGYERDLTVNGSDWLWTVTAIYAVVFLLIHFHTFLAKSNEKIFHYLFTISLLTGLIVYFSEASNLGWNTAYMSNEVDKGDPRQLFWAKYVYWVVAFPQVVITLGLISNVSWATMLYWVGLSWIWIISYYVGSYVDSNYRWGFFVFGTISYFALACSVALDGMKGAKRVETTKHYTLLMGWVQLLWLLYPLAWGLTDGGNYQGVTPMFIWFGILDVLMVPVLAFAVLFFSRSWDYGKMNLHFTQYGRVPQGGAYPEKEQPVATGAQAA